MEPGEKEEMERVKDGTFVRGGPQGWILRETPAERRYHLREPPPPSEDPREAFYRVKVGSNVASGGRFSR